MARSAAASEVFNDMSSPRDTSDPRRSTLGGDWPRFEIECVIESGDGSDRCTLHPRDALSEELVGTWITAAEGSFVSVTAIR